MAGLGGYTPQTSQVPGNTNQVIQSLIAPSGGVRLKAPPGGTPNFGAIPDTTQTGRRTSSGTQTAEGTKRKKETTTSTAREQGRTQSMEQGALDTLNATIAQIAAGEDPVLSAIDEARTAGLARSGEIDLQADPFDAASRAQGRVQGFQRQLLEQVLPEIFGGAEAAGIAGNNALSMLLSQDAATRTSEASARVEEEAYTAAIQSRIANQQALQGLLEGGGAQNEALLDALGLAKGAVETTDLTRTGESTTEGEEVTDSTTTTSGTDETTSSGIDPIEWAKLQAQLAMFGASQPTAQEKAIAMFQATKTPNMDLQRAFNPPGFNVGFTGLTPSGKASQQYFSALGGRV